MGGGYPCCCEESSHSSSSSSSSSFSLSSPSLSSSSSSLSISSYSNEACINRCKDDISAHFVQVDIEPTDGNTSICKDCGDGATIGSAISSFILHPYFAGGGCQWQICNSCFAINVFIGITNALFINIVQVDSNCNPQSPSNINVTQSISPGIIDCCNGVYVFNPLTFSGIGAACIFRGFKATVRFLGC